MLDGYLCPTCFHGHHASLASILPSLQLRNPRLTSLVLSRIMPHPPEDSFFTKQLTIQGISIFEWIIRKGVEPLGRHRPLARLDARHH